MTKNQESPTGSLKILIIGGTTEGRVAVQVCDDAGKPFFYSTKNTSQQVESANGTRLSGGLDEEEMMKFCKTEEIKLIIDAAHPFAEIVHRNVGVTAQELNIPVIRMERTFPNRNNNLFWADTYEEAIELLNRKKVKKLLALTGVNTIEKLRPFWEKHTTVFRIMKRDESMAVVAKNRFPESHILFYEDERDDKALITRIEPNAVITKESGDTGGFTEKVEAALSLNIPVVVIRRPPLPYHASATVYGAYGLRKQIELLNVGFFELRSGFTTGSCATAAAKAATTALYTGRQQQMSEIILPSGEPINIPIAKTEIKQDMWANCTVVKDAGDDPDVTHGTDIMVIASFNPDHEGIRIMGGKGVGRITLPGLGLEIGDAAINHTPRMMITREVHEVVVRYSDDEKFGIDITISVPKGEELALKTFNPRLGIVGGISIIGTSGIVKPFSSDAFIGSIRRETEVAKALNIKHIYLNSGAKSEKHIKNRHPQLPQHSFVQYGNFIGDALSIAHNIGFEAITLTIMLGKAVKLAEGRMDTHSKKNVMNKEFIIKMALEAGCSAKTVEKITGITLARELWGVIQKDEKQFFSDIIKKCHSVCQPLVIGSKLSIILMDDEGNVVE